MKKQMLSIALMLCVFTGFAQTWKVDPPHSRLGFTVVHMSISDVTGRFNKFDVSIDATKPDFSDAKVELTADVASINTDVEMRDTHLKSPDFFDAEKYPTLSFKSSGITRLGKGNRYRLTGYLTMHGVEKPVTMTLTYRGTTTNPQSKKKVAGFQVMGVIRRSDFGIGNKFPSVMLSDNVMIKADGEFMQP